MEETNNKDMLKATQEEKTRAVPKPNASSDKRDRTAELPVETVTNEELAEKIEAANETANQTIDEGNENEVQGKAPVPNVPVMKRGSTKWTDDAGVVQKKLNEGTAPEAKEEDKPQYQVLHQQVLDGADPIKATLAMQDTKPEEAFQEGKVADTEKYPRTGAATVRPAETEDDR